MPLYTRHRVIEAVLNEILGLHNKHKAVVHSVHKLTGKKKEKKQNEEEEKEEEKKEEKEEEEKKEKKKGKKKKK
jgi:ribosomal protein L12E/L44/L45/RPP1/RPP2